MVAPSGGFVEGLEDGNNWAGQNWQTGMCMVLVKVVS
jgi:hypothetical protein